MVRLAAVIALALAAVALAAPPADASAFCFASNEVAAPNQVIYELGVTGISDNIGFPFATVKFSGVATRTACFGGGVACQETVATVSAFVPPGAPGGLFRIGFVNHLA